MVAPGASSWGVHGFEIGHPSAAAEFTRTQMWGGGKGFGVHWMPVGRPRWGETARMMMGGPGLPATGFVDIAIRKAGGEVEGQLLRANELTARLAEDFSNRGSYRSIHEMKTGKAGGVYGENLWRDVADYPPSPTSGVKYGKFNITETAGMKEMSKDLRAGLTPTDIKKISHLPPLVKSVKFEDIGGLTSGDISKFGYTKGQYTFFRSAPVSPKSMHEVDVAVMRTDTGKWKGFAEFGVSDFRETDPSMVGGKWTSTTPGEIKGGKIGRDFYVHGGYIVEFYAEEGIHEGLTAAAREARQLYREVMYHFRFTVKKYAAVNFNSMVRGRSTDRGRGYFRGQENTFDALTDIAVNLSFPGNEDGARMYHVGVYYHHPVATAWNYGLSGAAHRMLINYTPGMGTRSWRLKPPVETTKGV